MTNHRTEEWLASLQEIPDMAEHVIASGEFCATHQQVCPSCGALSRFTLIGVQTFPEEVAVRANLPAKMGLYRCENCLTTRSHMDMQSS